MKVANQARLLPLVILALVAFAGLKLTNVWFGFSAADAQESFKASAPAAPGSAVAELHDEAVAARDAPPPVLPPSEVERRILEKLAARRQALDLREEELKTREAVLIATEKQLDNRIAIFEREQANLTALRDENQQAETKELDALVSAYERMKSKDAAAIFNELDEDILVPVAAGMRTQALSGVLANMAPGKARTLTRLLAERNRVDGLTPVEAGANGR